jgi:hypothetical protein
MMLTNVHCVGILLNLFFMNVMEIQNNGIARIYKIGSGKN